MDSTPEPERGDLLALVRQVRGQLLRHAAAGTWATSARASLRRAPEPAGEANDGAAEARSDAQHHGELIARAARPSLASIRAEVGDCQRCKLCSTRRSIVFGVGAEDAPLMFVGEAPGEQEDRRGEPFVGPAGELLDKMIEAMGWSRQTVYIANVLMCRPPGNRTPQPDEIERCLPFLAAKISTIGPRILVALGRPAANTLLGTDAPISALRGRFHDRNGVRVMPTFHPAYLLREPDKKRDVWSDLKLVIAELARLGIAAPGVARG